MNVSTVEFSCGSRVENGVAIILLTQESFGKLRG